MPAPVKTLHAVIHGRVQGVGFRYFVQAVAEELGIRGWVRNQADGSVETEGQGDHVTLEKWLERLREGPPLARVERVSSQWGETKNGSSSFEITA